MKYCKMILLMAALLAMAGCAPRISVFGTPATAPLKEMVVDGKSDQDGRIALINLRGFLSSEPGKGLFGARPSTVQRLVNGLDMAESDDDIKGVVIAIDSPGGTTTASDILYHEIERFKERSKKPVVAAMLDVAASGGYYAALASDWIVAHPTTITGSVGVVFLRPKLVGLMNKVGVDVEVTKSGRDKDMGSPFRPTTPEEQKLFQNIIDDFASRFYGLVEKNRPVSAKDMETVKTARVFTAQQAKQIGLIDQIGYLQDAFAKTRKMCKLPEDAQVVTFRRNEYPNDNPYNTLDSTDPAKLQLLGLDSSFLAPPKSGFFYVWPQGLSN